MCVDLALNNRLWLICHKTKKKNNCAFPPVGRGSINIPTASLQWGKTLPPLMSVLI